MLFYHCGYRSVASPLGVSLSVCISCLSMLVYCCVSWSVACFSAVFVYRSAVSQCWSIVVSLGLSPILWLYSFIDQLSLSLLLCLSVCFLFSGPIHLSIRDQLSSLSIGLFPILWMYSFIDQLSLSVGLVESPLSVRCFSFGCCH